MNELTQAVVTIATAIVGVAILSVLVSQRSQTAGVLQAGGNAFATALSAATGPVTGGGAGNFNFGSQGSYGNNFQMPQF